MNAACNRCKSDEINGSLAKECISKQKKEYFCKIFNKLEIIIFCNPAKILVAKCLQFSK